MNYFNVGIGLQSVAAFASWETPKIGHLKYIAMDYVEGMGGKERKWGIENSVDRKTDEIPLS